VFEGRAIVFDGAEDYRARINDPDLQIDEGSILVMRGAGPIGWPGSAEVVNMQPPDNLLKQGITSLPTLGDGRQSGTSASPSIVNASPESFAGGGLALLKTGDRIRIDLGARRCDVLLSETELQGRRQDLRPELRPAETPWQLIYRNTVGELSDGACIRDATEFQKISQTTPRHNH